MITFSVNGREQKIEADPAMPLLWVLRDLLDLPGSKYGCGMALCGACVVHVDGESTRSCVLPVGSVGRRKVTTIEGVTGTVAKAVQDAWIALDVVQCGYCQSGQIMSAIGLLATNKAPSDDDIDTAMSGNICRCATYLRIRAAIKLAARNLRV